MRWGHLVLTGKTDLVGFEQDCCSWGITCISCFISRALVSPVYLEVSCSKGMKCSVLKKTGVWNMSLGISSILKHQQQNPTGYFCSPLSHSASQGRRGRLLLPGGISQHGGAAREAVSEEDAEVQGFKEEVAVCGGNW